MEKSDIYSNVLDYMCENYDYSLYATDFNTKTIMQMQDTYGLVVSSKKKIEETKTALQDFFDAIFQRVFVYEDDERLKIVKYFDKGALSENQDKQIHALRQELLTCRDDVSKAFSNNSLYMFDKVSRKRFEITIISLIDMPKKEILREQISLVYALEQKDIVVFLNGKIFLKKFHNKKPKNQSPKKSQEELLYDERFIDSLWEEVNIGLDELLRGSFDFFRLSPKEFYEKFPVRFFSVIKRVLKNSLDRVSDDDISHFAGIAFKGYLRMGLKIAAKYIFDEVLEGELRAIKFLKSYSQSTKITNNKMRLKKAPLMNRRGNIYNYQAILMLLKEKELINSKITHKKIELKNIQKRVKKSQLITQRSEDEMERIQKRRLKLLLVIEKVEYEIKSMSNQKPISKLNISRLEFSRRDLLEEFKQVELRLRTQKNILDNADKELKKWEEKKEDNKLLKEELLKKQVKIVKEYDEICEVFASLLGKEPLVL